MTPNTTPRESDASARAVQATEHVWQLIASEFGLLSAGEATALIGTGERRGSQALDLRRHGELLAVVREEAWLLPGFQFDRATGDRPLPWAAPLLKLAGEHHLSASDVIMWMMAPTTYFFGDRPVERLDETEQLLDVAERAWGIEW